jgi:hypothetical protein
LKKNDEKISEWLSKTPNSSRNVKLERADSYFEHLAGKYFVPDSHDFEATEKVKIMMMQTYQGHNEFSKTCHPPESDKKDIENHNFIEGSIKEWETHEVNPPCGQIIIPKPRLETVATKGRSRPTTGYPSKRLTSANIAVRMTRSLMTVPMGSSQPKLKRPFTARPYTTASLSSSIFEVPKTAPINF